MNDLNPYSTPDAALENEQQEFYQPKIFSFKGRIGRLRYMAYGIGTYFVVMAVFMPILGGTMLMGGSMPVPGEGGISIPMIAAMVIFYIAVILLSVAFGKRRLNDLNRSGWWILILIVPLVNLLMTIYILFFPGSSEANDFGPPPVANSLGVKILGWLFPVIFLLGIVAAIAVPQYQQYVSQAGQAQTQ
jgi:uncharacterized membrane protein YhaH (DUF805 family)